MTGTGATEITTGKVMTGTGNAQFSAGIGGRWTAALTDVLFRLAVHAAGVSLPAPATRRVT